MHGRPQESVQTTSRPHYMCLSKSQLCFPSAKTNRQYTICYNYCLSVIIVECRQFKTTRWKYKVGNIL